MSQLIRKTVSKETPKEQECAGWCGEVFPTPALTAYKKKLYCKDCLTIKQNEVKKPAGLTEDAVTALIQNALENYKKTIPMTTVESPNLQLRDLVITARTIFAHLAGLERFTSKRMNGRQGDDMRAWLVQADKILEGK